MKGIKNITIFKGVENSKNGGGIYVVSLKYEKDFFKWLAEKDSRPQLGEFYFILQKIKQYGEEKIPETKVIDEKNIDSVSDIVLSASSEKFSLSEKKFVNSIFLKFRIFLEEMEKEKVVKEKKLDSLNSNTDLKVLKNMNFNKVDPVKFRCLRKKYTKVASWEELYIKVIKFLWEEYPIVFDEMLFDTEDMEKNRISFNYATYKRQMRSPEMIGDYFCIDVPKNGKEMLKNIKWVLDCCGVKYEMLEIIAKSENTNVKIELENEETEDEPVEIQEDNNVKEVEEKEIKLEDKIKDDKPVNKEIEEVKLTKEKNEKTAEDKKQENKIEKLETIEEKAEQIQKIKSIVLGDEVKELNLNKLKDINFEILVPYEVKYRHKKLGFSRSWKDAYVNIASEVYKNCGFLLAEWIGKPLFEDGKNIDIADGKSLDNLRVPQVISSNTTENLFIETDYSNDEIVMRIKKLLDISLIKYENFLISYKEIIEVETEEIEEQSCDEKAEEVNICILDLKKEYDLSKSLPISLEIGDRIGKEYKSWGELYLNLLDILWNKYGMYIRPGKSDNIEEIPLSQVSVTDNLSPEEIVKKIKIILKMYSIDYSKCKITVQGSIEKIENKPKEKVNLGEILEINYSNLSRLAYTIPVGFSYKKVRSVKSFDWGKVYCEIFKIIWRADKKDLEDYIEKPILKGASNAPIDISRNKSIMSIPRKIDDDIYLETDYEPYEILKRIRQIITISSFRFEEFPIYYRRFSGHEFKKITEKLQLKRQKQLEKNKRFIFYNWMINEENISAKIAQNYISAVDEVERYVKEFEIGTGKVYGHNRMEECRETLALLFNDEKFKLFNEKHHHKHMAASKQYLNFLSCNIDKMEYIN